MRNDLILIDGGYDRAAIMRDAHRQYRLMGRHGWDFPRCLKFSLAKARAQQQRAAWAMVENAARAAVASQPRPLAF